MPASRRRPRRGVGGIYSIPDFFLGRMCPLDDIGAPRSDDSTFTTACREYNNRTLGSSLPSISGPVVPPLVKNPVGVAPSYDPVVYGDSVVNDVIAGTAKKQSDERLAYFQALDRQINPDDYADDGTPKTNWTPFVVGAVLAVFGVFLVRTVAR